MLIIFWTSLMKYGAASVVGESPCIILQYICNICIILLYEIGSQHAHTLTHEVMRLNLKPYIIQAYYGSTTLLSHYILHYSYRCTTGAYTSFDIIVSSVDYFAACLLCVHPRHRLSSARAWRTAARTSQPTPRPPHQSFKGSRDRRY